MRRWLHTYEDAALQVKGSAVVQHLGSFLWLVYPTRRLTPAVRCEKGGKLICITDSLLDIHARFCVSAGRYHLVG